MPHLSLTHSASSRTCLWFMLISRSLGALVLILSHGICLAQQEIAPAKKEEGVMIRILCVQSVSSKEEEAMLATKKEDGTWIEHTAVTLRTPFISEWIRLPHGTIHLTNKEEEPARSLGSFVVPEKPKRLIVVLLPDTKKNGYQSQVIDPENLGFQKGKALIINYGKVRAAVRIGERTVTVNPGQQVVEKIDANQDGMYRLLIGHLDDNQKIVPCYDRFVSSNANTRKFILLFPDQQLGLRAMSLSEFGPFE